jgi:class 3 adenylate cyclase
MGHQRLVIGPLSADAESYVAREADRQTVGHLERLDYVQITDPRQQGKTSLLFRLKRLLPESHRVVYVDMESLRSDAEAAWYEDLASRLASQLVDVVDFAGAPRAYDCSSFRAFLLHLVKAQRDGGRRPIVIALDEVGSLTMSWAEGFFRVLREVYTVREFEAPFKLIGFVLAGAFDPGTLIRDAAISPFNVAHWVRLDDFSLAELETMAERMTVDEPGAAAHGVHEWTDGQPYLAHNLCVRLGRHEGRGDPDVREAVRWLLENDTHHLRALRRRLEDHPDLANYAARALTEGVKLSPSVNPRHFELAHVVGIVKADERGVFRVRNRIYAEGLADALKPPARVAEVGAMEKAPLPGDDFERWAGGKEVILAIVFTDIVGSTALGNEQGDERMEEIRRPHFARLEKALGKHGGRKIKELGDGAMAVFKTTGAALDFALDLWRDTGHPLVNVRAGIHTGTVTIHAGDAFGNAVNFAARVSSAAAGAEIYVSDRAKQDIDTKKAARHAGIGWRSCDDVALKGFPGRHRLWTLAAPASIPSE